MSSKVITLRDWGRQAQTVQPPEGVEKPREEKKPQSFLSILKKQSTEDRISTILICLVILFGSALVVTQIGIWQGW